MTDTPTAQHYLVHLLRERLVESRARIVFVSSGVIRRVQDISSPSITSSCW